MDNCRQSLRSRTCLRVPSKRFYRRSVHYFAHHLMSRNQLMHLRPQFAFNDVKICPAYTTGADSKENVPRLRFGLRHFHDHKRPCGKVSRSSEKRGFRCSRPFIRAYSEARGVLRFRPWPCPDI
jgi:hypothetical protein